jgi:hypothetical protein
MISVTFGADSTGRNLPKIQALFGCLPAWPSLPWCATMRA